MRKTIVSLTTLVATLLFATASFAGPFSDSINSSSKKSFSSNAIKASPATKYTQPPSINPTPVPPYNPAPNKNVLNPNKGPHVVDKKPTVPTLPTPLPPPKTTPMPPGPVADKGGPGHHHHGYPYLGFGLAAAGIAAAAAAPTVVEYVQQPIYAPAPVASPYAPAAAQALPAPAMENPFDAFVGRLNGLAMALQQGLITKDEYRAQRQAVMASLDAGRVSRTVGIQDGLRQLKMMADGGALTPREYDDKRKEFVLYL